MTLNQLAPGKTSKVTAINLSGAIYTRLLDLGMIKGTKVKCVLENSHGNPKAYRIRGALIALRNEDTKNIEIKAVGENDE